MGSRMGYEYHYCFGMDDEIISRYGSWYSEGWRCEIRYVFETRTNFKVKIRSDDDEILLLDSERYDIGAPKDSTEGYLKMLMGEYRLQDYWMSADEIKELVCKALAFAKQKEAADPRCASYRLIPIAIELDVCTVQQEGEPIDATIDRAIRAENLFPLDIVQINQTASSIRKEGEHLDPVFANFLREDLLRDTIRVEDIDKGLCAMEECSICLRKPTIGAQISTLGCHHTFHYHCIVRWLENKRSCPTCRRRAYKGMSLIESFLERMNV